MELELEISLALALAWLVFGWVRLVWVLPGLGLVLVALGVVAVGPLGELGLDLELVAGEIWGMA